MMKFSSSGTILAILGAGARSPVEISSLSLATFATYAAPDGTSSSPLLNASAAVPDAV